LKKREEKKVTFTIPKKSLQVVDEEGNRFLDSKQFTLYIGISQPDSRSTTLTGIKPVELTVQF
jgi:beta-glucosidase